MATRWSSASIPSEVRSIWPLSRPNISLVGRDGSLAHGRANSRIAVKRSDPSKPNPNPAASSDTTGQPPEVLVDEVHYANTPPWPADSNATGYSLQLFSGAYGNDPANWRAHSPPPPSPTLPRMSIPTAMASRDAWRSRMLDPHDATGE